MRSPSVTPTLFITTASSFPPTNYTLQYCTITNTRVRVVDTKHANTRNLLARLHHPMHHPSITAAETLQAGSESKQTIPSIEHTKEFR
jgi:hypothetical protein